LDFAFNQMFFPSAPINPLLPPPPPPALPTLLQYYCPIIEQYTTPPPNSRLYAIHHTILVITISCKGQTGMVYPQRGAASVGGRRRSVRPPPSARRRLPDTRYAFTSRLLCTNQPSFYCPSRLHRPHGCNTIAIHYCAIVDPLPSPRFHAVHHTIVFIARSCKGQDAGPGTYA